MSGKSCTLQPDDNGYEYNAIHNNDSPIRQTFELGKFISIAGKNILNLVKLGSLVAKYRKMWKIQSFEVCEFYMLLLVLLYYARKSVTTFRNVVINFPNSKVCLIGEWSINKTNE